MLTPSAPRNRPIRIRRLRSGFRATVARKVYTETAILTLMRCLMDDGHSTRRVSCWIDAKHPAHSLDFFSVVDATRFFSHNFWYPALLLGSTNHLQQAKIVDLGGTRLSISLKKDSWFEVYVFSDRVLGIMTSAYIQRQNLPDSNHLLPDWEQIIEDCPTLESIADRYFNDNDTDALDLVRVVARLAA